MEKIQLPYGQTTIEFDYQPEQWQLITPPESDLLPLSRTDILVAMANPIEGQPLEDIIDIGEQVVIVVSDSTRATASDRIVPLLVARLLECGLRTTDLSILFATGIHRQPTETEVRALLTDAIYQAIPHYFHNAYDAAELVYLGDTRFGNRVEINRRLVAASHVILTGSIGFHYLAGFSGGRKSILPGLASAAAIEHNHLLALDFSAETAKRRAGVGSGRLDGNAVHEDMQEAATLLAPSFLINTVLNEEREIVQIFCGDWRDAHRRGCAEYVTHHTALIREKRELVIASCGGAPKDINLIQAHKALDIAAGATVEGGDIILLAECPEGLGRADFLSWFEAGHAAQIAARLRTDYQVNGQTAWALKSKAERFRIILVSQLPETEVRQIGLHPAADLAAALSTLPKDRSGYLIPYATAVIPLIKAE